VWLHRHVRDVRHWAHTRTENSTIVATYERDRSGFSAAVREAGTLAKPTGLPKTVMAAALYLIRKGNSPDHVDPWVEGLRTGENLSSGDPRLALVRWARSARTERKRRHGHEVLAVVLKAWNAHAEGRRMTVLAWRLNETMPTVTKIGSPST
jgi:hypothetical protein